MATGSVSPNSVTFNNTLLNSKAMGQYNNSANLNSFTSGVSASSYTAASLYNN